MQKQQDEQDDGEDTIAFSKNWLTEKKKIKYVLTFLLYAFFGCFPWCRSISLCSFGCRTAKEKNKKRARDHGGVATEEDVVEDLILSSDEEDENNDQESDEDGSIPVEDDNDEDFVDPDSEWKKQKKAKSMKRNKRQPSSKAPSKTKRKPHPKKAKH